MTATVSPVSPEELLPCPHCGGTNIVGPMYCEYSGDAHKPHTWIECEDCPAFMEVWTPEVADAIAAWNRRATAPSGAKVPQWQPIETAPKDGTCIALGCVEDDDQAAVSTVGWWQEAAEDSIDDMGQDAGFVDHGYQVFDPGRSFGNRQYPGIQPTHWQPLPAAPTPE
jgi:Lar family restriction alleviation protein